MKGVHVSIIIGLTIGIIVIAVVVAVFMYLTNLEVVGVTGDLNTLRQYSSCVLAYCATGVGSDEVKAVGCLERENGKCTMTCEDVYTKVYLEKDIAPSFQEGPGGRGADHFCGPTAALSFEFEGPNIGGGVQLYSGQMDTITKKPQWICKPIKVPFTDIELPGTADLQHKGIGGAPQNCIILSGGGPPVAWPGKEGCFLSIKYDKSYENIYYTPLIQYDSQSQIIYPSAIYVDRTFSEPLPGELNPECDYRNSDAMHNPPSLEQVAGKVKGAVQGSDSPTLADFDNPNEIIGNVLNKCNFKESYKGEKITYAVWAKPVYPDLEAFRRATGAEPIEKILTGVSGDFFSHILGSSAASYKAAFTILTDSGVEALETLFSQVGGSCTAVVIGRDLDVPVPQPSQKIEIETFSF